MKKNKHLSSIERDRITILQCEGLSIRKIAAILGRSPSTISREFKRPNAVCGGGRYDSLVRNLGGEDTPAIGFAMGMERLASLLGEKEEAKTQAFIVCNNSIEGIKLTEELRGNGITAEFDLTNKKFVKQLEKASKVAKYAVILGEDEIQKGQVTIKNLETSEQKTVLRQDIFTTLQ